MLNDTISYTYDSTWKDKLASYEGNGIKYDEIGNPLSYGCGAKNPNKIAFIYQSEEIKLLQRNFFEKY